MKLLPAKTVATVALGVASSALQSSARTCSLESLTCLFELAKPRLDPPVIAFSLLPLVGGIALHPLQRILAPAAPESVAPEQPASPVEFITRFLDPQRPLGPEPAPDAAKSWPLLEALRSLRANPHVNGLSHNLTDPNSYVALDYSDIFESGRAPYKGGHGVSLFFRHDF